eukprot:TRINITY_DN71508_c0_g1_i1.p1 TRINITY_DN71508_c0_g1~~TRINITY_DN71508_c0_g1_i1.p1  ORF type:complete len:348 (+),score=113.06 TRINITY_DN71508_c0_g1_i1:151-1194(+)
MAAEAPKKTQEGAATGAGGKGKGKRGGKPTPEMMMMMMKGMKGGWRRGGGGKKVAEDFSVDPEARFQGKVSAYSKFSGYGFIELTEKGLIPDDKLFVHWKNITTSDRFPSLVKDMDVECCIQKAKNNTVHAIKVTLPGGGDVKVQDEADAAKKEFVGGQFMRYTGTLKWFDPRRGMGYITIDDGFSLGEGVPKEIKAETSEVNAAGRQPPSMKDQKVEFGIWKTKRDEYKAYNVTRPGGSPLTQESLENRQTIAGPVFSGEIEMWNWRNGWGFVTVSDDKALPPAVAEKQEEARKEAEAKGKSFTNALYFRKSDVRNNCKLDKGEKVQFTLYVDDKGAGAMDVHSPA